MLRTALVASALAAAPVALLGLAGTAHATDISVGTSYGIGLQSTNFGFASVGSVRALPSLDLYFDKFILRLYPLDLLNNLASDNIVLAVDGYVGAVEQPIGGSWNGVVQPGGNFAIADFDSLLVEIAGSARLGAETGDGAHVGAYVVPMIGIGIADGELALITGGRIEMSVWF